MEPTSSSGVSLLTMLLPILLAVTIALGVTSGVDLTFLKDGGVQYDYEATCTLQGETKQMSVSASLDKGVPAFKATLGDQSVQLKNSLITMTNQGEVTDSQVVPGVALEAVKEGLGYLADGGLKDDLNVLLPYFADILSYNAYTLTTESRTNEEGRPVTYFTVETTPIRLLSALQRWMMVHGSDPQLRKDINDLKALQLPVVQLASMSLGGDLGSLAGKGLIGLADSLKYSLSSGVRGLRALTMNIYLSGTLDGGRLAEGYLQVSDALDSQVFWLNAYYQIMEDGSSRATVYCSIYSLEVLTAEAVWDESGKVDVSAHWAIPSYISTSDNQPTFDDFTGGDFLFRYEVKKGRPKISLDLSVYNRDYSPSVTLRYESRRLDFLFIENPDYDSRSYQYSYLSPYVRGVFSWDDSAYTLYAEGREFRLDSKGTYDAAEGSFHQKGQFDLRLADETTFPRETSWSLEQTFSLSDRTLRLVQHLDACGRDKESLIVYDDSHVLAIH